MEALSETDSTPQDGVPDSVRRSLDHLMRSGEEFRLSVSSDIGLAGRYGAAWLLATDSSLIAFSPNGEAPDIVHLPLADIRSVEIRELSGSGVIKVRTEGRGATVAVFSKALIGKFSSVPKQLEILVKEARPEWRRGEGELVEGSVGAGRGNGKRCERCNRVIPHWWGVCPACLDKRKLITRLLSYTLPHRGMVALSLTLMLVGTFIGLTPPLLMKSLVDDVLTPVITGADAVSRAALTPVITGDDAVSGAALKAAEAEASVSPVTTAERTRQLGVLVVLLLLVHVVQNGLGAVRGYIMAVIGQKVTFDLRNQVYRQLHRLSLSFYNERETGRIMASVTQDVGRLQDFISDGLQEVIRDVLTLLIICGILFYLNSGLAALVLLPTPFLVLATLKFGKRLHTIYRGLWRRWSGISALLADVIPGVRVVKAFAQEGREVIKFEGRSEALLSGELRVARIRSLFSPVMAFLTSIGTLIIWWVGGEEVIGGSLSLGEFLAFTQYMWRFYGPVESLCRLNHRFQRAATSAERVFEVVDTPPAVADRPGAVQMPRIDGRVVFAGASFAYEPGQPILNELDFTVEPGEMIGLAGHSGAGKSTLINLICRFYDVQEGAITIDGHDIRDVTLKSLRDQLGVVLQDPFLFNGTVAENIAYGHPTASLDDIVSAAKAANCHEFVLDLPDSYDTLVGERGARVSGGERQRISIARAILRDPRILILDEATSNVDTETEVQIQEAFERLIKGRTTFAIAHRLSTLRHSSRLLILDKGRVSEIGTHEELIEAGGVYSRLCKIQTDMSKIRAW